MKYISIDLTGAPGSIVDWFGLGGEFEDHVLTIATERLELLYWDRKLDDGSVAGSCGDAYCAKWRLSASMWRVRITNRVTVTVDLEMANPDEFIAEVAAILNDENREDYQQDVIDLTDDRRFKVVALHAFED